MFLPGESEGWGSLVGCRLWGRTESDTTEAAQQQQQQQYSTRNYLYYLTITYAVHQKHNCESTTFKKKEREQQKGKCGVQKSVLKAYLGGSCGLCDRMPSSRERWGLRINCWAASAMPQPSLNPQHRTQSAVGMEVLSAVCITRPLANTAPEVIWSGVE